MFFQSYKNLIFYLQQYYFHYFLILHLTCKKKSLLPCLNDYYFIWKKITITLCVGAFAMGTHIAHNIELRVPSRNLVCRKTFWKKAHTLHNFTFLKSNFCPFFPSYLHSPFFFFPFPIIASNFAVSNCAVGGVIQLPVSILETFGDGFYYFYCEMRLELFLNRLK